MRKESNHVIKTNQWNIKEDSKRGKGGKKKKARQTKTMNKMAITCPSLSVITLNINGLPPKQKT